MVKNCTEDWRRGWICPILLICVHFRRFRSISGSFSVTSCLFLAQRYAYFHHCTVLGWVIKSTSLAHHLHCTLLPSVINFHIKWSWNDDRGKWECVIKSPLKSLPSLITSLENDHGLMTVGSKQVCMYCWINVCSRGHCCKWWFWWWFRPGLW